MSDQNQTPQSVPSVQPHRPEVRDDVEGHAIKAHLDNGTQGEAPEARRSIEGEGEGEDDVDGHAIKAHLDNGTQGEAPEARRSIEGEDDVDGHALRSGR